MTLKTPLSEALLDFRLQLPEDYVNCWNKSLAIVCLLDLLPASHCGVTLKDMQGKISDNRWAFPFDTKLMALEEYIQLEHSDTLRLCFMFLFKFYDYLKKSCPGFRPIWYISLCSPEEKKEEFVLLTSFFARHGIQDYKQHGFNQEDILTQVVEKVEVEALHTSIDNDEKVWDNFAGEPVDESAGWDEVLD
jgi:hypothetical protein